MPAAENASDTAAVSVPTPVVPARGHSASASADTARCTATSDEEHAVSSVRHGPVSPSVYEKRPEATDSAPEVPEYTEGPLSKLTAAFGEALATALATLPPAPR